MPTTSTFLALTGGGQVRVDFNQVGFDTSVAFQRLDAAGQPLEASHTVHVGRTSSTSGQPFTRIDHVAAVAISDGGFVVAYAENVRPIVGGPPPPFETLSAQVYDGGGVARGFSQIEIGANLANDATFDAPDLFALSDGRWGLVYERLDGAASSLHLSVQASGVPAIDVPLASQPVSMAQTDSDLTLTLANGDRVMVGGSAHANLTGGDGADTIVGGPTTEVLRGGSGSDSVMGGAGFDDINGNMGNDTCVSGGGDDWVVGGKDNDSLVGSEGQNLVYGNLGADTCDGGAGNDIVRGGQDNDTLEGGAGDDFVSGDKGDDTVAGGAGADIFHTFGDAGTDRVLDFSLAEGDRVQLDPGTQFTVSQVGADTVISMTGGGQMMLVGVAMSTLTGSWIFGA